MLQIPPEAVAFAGATMLATALALRLSSWLRVRQPSRATLPLGLSCGYASLGLGS